MVRCIVAFICSLCLTLSGGEVQASEDGAIAAGNTELDATQKIQIKTLENLSGKGIKSEYRIPKKDAAEMIEATKNGNITSKMITKFGADFSEFNVNLIYFGNGNIDGITAGPEAQRLLNEMNTKIPESELNEMIDSVKMCAGGLHAFGGKLDKGARNCFTQLDKLKVAISPENSGDKTYTKSLDFVSSLVDSNNKHLCMISVYKPGIWVTANHCFNNTLFKFGAKILVDGKFIKIQKEDVTPCKENGCDIAFVKATTPKLPDYSIPYAVQNYDKISRKTDILVPGIPLGENLSDIQSRAAYNQKLIWEDYGNGFCHIYKRETSGCIVHACSTLIGFSGAPIYTYNYETKNIDLIGVHSGGSEKENRCEAINVSANFGRAIKNIGLYQ